MQQGIQLFGVVTASLALGAHQWLKRYDPVDFKVAAAVLTILPFIPSWLLFQTCGYPLLLSIGCAFALFHTILLASVIGYRLSPFHPLAAYPGPTIMKVTKLWGAWIAYKGKTHIYLKAIHDKYGSVVRIGPNELSTTEKGFLSNILGSQGMPKGPMWDGRRFAQTDAQKDYDNIIDLRDPSIHAQLRKPWNKAFSAEPLKDYELLLQPRIAQIIGHLKDACRQGGESGVGRVNIAKWVSCFTFDFIGDVAFGGSFQLMKEGDKEGTFHNMEAAMYLPSITHHVPWISKVMRYFPLVNGGMTRFINFGLEKALARYAMEMKRKDLFYHMSEASNNLEAELPLIISNALLAIVAGSDTSAFTLSCAWYLLLSNPESYLRLQAEVDEIFDKYEIPDMDIEATPDMDATQTRYGDILGSMPYLNAVINEALRMFPSVTTGLQRAPEKGSGGKVLQSGSLSVFLPEGNAITVPAYVLHRDPRHFSPRPDSFIPERWISSSTTGSEGEKAYTTKFTTSRDAFIPFSLGQQNCVGRPLALMSMRYLLAALIRNFDMEFDGAIYDKNQWEAKMEDRYTCQSKGTLPITIKWRGATRKGGIASSKA